MKATRGDEKWLAVIYGHNPETGGPDANIVVVRAADQVVAERTVERLVKDGLIRPE